MTSDQTKILLVDDDLRLRDLLERYLAEQGMSVRTVADGRAMDNALERERFDVLVLDWMLPGEDGLSICRRLQVSHAELPIVMLTAKADEIDRIVGLEMGADDYLPKPFNPRELVARIKAVMRRRVAAPPGAPAPDNTELNFGACRLNLGTRELFRDASKLPLTSGEFAVLKALVEHPRQPLSRERLMVLARGRDHEAYDRSIDVQISRLRKLIESDPAAPHHIQTVRGFGYVFVPD
ncbi:two-component system response regulator OmpR [Thiobacillus sp.]|uniref:osmolarity response regulator transcription factor OmpR n=1 Tax=Thiobacillus sp. TaxID=924 RepID=UPI0025D39202|nr:two-component system response regulator OmpR [Thiobacillus sp.]MBT9539484.1 two-component system response regulator OmpR [Thiobacillus sp.]